MTNKLEKYFVLIPVMFIAVMTAFCDSGTKEKEGSEKTGAVVGRYKEAVSCVECVKNETGATLGFQISLLNSSREEQLVLLVDYTNFEYHFTVSLFDADGMPVSPGRRPMTLFNLGPGKSRFVYDPVRPRSGRTWFIPFPHQIKVDPTIDDNANNLKPIESGTYKVKIIMSMNYFCRF